jgi:hypothetical protein
MPTEIEERYLSWTILLRSCQLVALARELGDKDLVSLLETAALHAGNLVGASRTLVRRIEQDCERAVAPSSQRRGRSRP